MKGFTSRKFLICAAAFLGSIGTSIAALNSDNQVVASVGIVCAIISAAIYAAVEAYVDGKALGHDDIPEKIFDEIELWEGEPENEDVMEDGQD